MKIVGCWWRSPPSLLYQPATVLTSSLEKMTFKTNISSYFSKSDVYFKCFWNPTCSWWQSKFEITRTISWQCNSQLVSSAGLITRILWYILIIGKGLQMLTTEKIFVDSQATVPAFEIKPSKNFFLTLWAMATASFSVTSLWISNLCSICILLLGCSQKIFI